jgi:hypothetical protein
MTDPNPDTVSTLADRITAELSSLVGQPISDCWRAADMAIFDFGPMRRIVNRAGVPVSVADLHLHLQCPWRFIDPARILFGRDDLRRPADDSIPADAFDPNRHDTALDAARRRWFDDHRPSPPVVTAARGDPYGGFRIEIAGGFALEAFPCNSKRGEYSEHWRLLGHRPDASHFVITGDGVEADATDHP